MGLLLAVLAALALGVFVGWEFGYSSALRRASRRLDALLRVVKK